MLLTLVIILVLIGSAVVGSLYSNFLVFYENFTQTENYHRARYASIAAIERAELVIKQREPGYVGSGGWILGELSFTGHSPSDKPISGFSYLGNTNDIDNKSTVFRKINSRATRIPTSGNGNVDKLLATNDSLNYNMMDYENAEVFLLYYDKSLGEPYDKKDCSKNNDCEKSKPNKISGELRLPQRIQDNFGRLNTSKSLFQQGGYKDDALVDWQLRGNFSNGSLKVPFTIFATQEAAGGGLTSKDSAIRESNLNDSGVKLEFSAKWEPRKSSLNDPSTPTIVSQLDNEIINRLGTNKFNKIFNDNSFSDVQLKLSLLNLVLGEGSLSKRYPFIEYYIDFGDTIASDKYFTIETEGNFGDYKIDNIIFKPTVTESILRSFTTIF